MRRSRAPNPDYPMSRLNIVIPMAGRGGRFNNAGYTMPKPVIPLHGVPMIQAVVQNITPSTDCRHVFIVLREHADEYGVDMELEHLVPGCAIVYVEEVTEGAACTVMLARKYIDNDEPMMIANSDQYVVLDMEDYLAQIKRQDLDGLIMTFRADHPKWSYCRLSGDSIVTEVVEKQVVSNEATTGIYNFRRGADFVGAAQQMIAADKRVNGEFYVAPVYNEMISKGAHIGVYNIGEEFEDMHGLGTPEDLEAFLENPRFKEIIVSKNDDWAAMSRRWNYRVEDE